MIDDRAQESDLRGDRRDCRSDSQRLRKKRLQAIDKKMTKIASALE